jgi:hypothetical protein
MYKVNERNYPFNRVLYFISTSTISWCYTHPLILKNKTLVIHDPTKPFADPNLFITLDETTLVICPSSKAHGKNLAKEESTLDPIKFIPLLEHMPINFIFDESKQLTDNVSWNHTLSNSPLRSHVHVKVLDFYNTPYFKT